MSPNIDKRLMDIIAWVHAGKEAGRATAAITAKTTWNYFYHNMQEHHPDKIAVGAVWPGFDDSKASWSRNRHMDYRCGKTFDDMLKIFRKYYGITESQRLSCWWKPGMIMKKAQTWRAA